MLCKHETVKVFPSHVEAEAAVLELQKAGFDMQKEIDRAQQILTRVNPKVAQEVVV
ncbi:hypothetical protein LC609_22935 [Nostoc sp. XA013]|nr:hypothetical protein [Nostoc sp. XA013]